MLKYVKGEYVEMTQEEVLELEKLANDVVEEMPTFAERIEAIEAAILEGVLANG